MRWLKKSVATIKVPLGTKSPFLPEEFAFSHDYCFLLHDLLAQSFVEGIKAEIFLTTIPLKNSAEKRAFSKKDGEELFKWLEARGYQNAIDEINYKSIASAVLSDFCHFIYEALQCSKKAKLTVAYYLLRKPLKENLFILEWLLARPEELLQAFGSSDKNKILIEKIPKDQKIEIIREAMRKTRVGEWVSPDFIYDLRYKKDAHYGLEGTWNKAVHLTTNSHEAYITEPYNFNFIFSNEDSHLSQWKGMYSTLPLLLKHAYEVVEALYATFARREVMGWEDKTNVRTDIGLILWARSIASVESPVSSHLHELESLYLELLEMESIHCDKCQHSEPLKGSLLQIIYDQVFKCSACGYSVPLSEVATG